MKKALFASLLILSNRGALPQGTIQFSTRIPGTLVVQIYGPLSSDPSFHQVGNGPANLPAGRTDWSRYPLIGANGVSGEFGGATTFAELLGAPGPNQPQSSLEPAVPTTIFGTGDRAGFVRGTLAVFNNVPPSDSQATVEMVAWDNSSGRYPTWTQAGPAWQAGLIAAGKSDLWNQTLGFGAQPAPPMFGAQCFNLYFVPEPSTLVLLGLGVALVCWRLRGGQRIH